MATTNQREPSLLYPPTEAARLIHPKLSPFTLERWRRQGTGPAFVKVGHRVGYTRDAIETWLEKQSRRHTAEKKR